MSSTTTSTTRTFSTAYQGQGVSLSSSYYVRNFYKANREFRTTAGRSGTDGNELSAADATALRRAVRQLGDFTYDDADDTNIRNSVLAFIETYNFTLSSTEESDDDKIAQYRKQLVSLSQKYSDAFDEIGITVKDDGTLAGRESLFKSASISKFESLFSKDAEYTQKVTSYAKKIKTRSDALYLRERNAASAKAQGKNAAAAAGGVDASGADAGDVDAGGTDGAEATEVAMLVAQSADLDSLLNTGIGKNVNITL